jgi:hypothetical protein
MFHAWGDYNERIQDKANGIPADEPVFLLRAQDNLMLPTLVYYLGRLCEHPDPDENMVIGVVRQIRRVREWRIAHMMQLKAPDTLAACAVPLETGLGTSS